MEDRCCPASVFALTTSFSAPLTGATVLSASSSSFLSTSVSSASTSCRRSASPAGERGDWFRAFWHSAPLAASARASRSLTHCVSVLCLASGWIAALTGLNANIPVGIIMLLIAALFTALSVCSLIMFKKVSRPAAGAPASAGKG